MPNAAQASTALSWYCWGSLSTIECGVDDAVEPRRWTGLEDADVVQCGGTHCLAVRSGQVHAWGANSHGQCGAERDNRIHPPTTVQFAVPVETVACGWWHSLVLTRDGRVASWGHPEQIGRDGDPFQCQLIPDICQVRQISCGFRHSIAVANDGSVYAWGQNKFGQLGIAPSKTMVARPVRSASIDARFASCGLRHSVVLTGSGAVISAGENRYGQLGRNTSASFCSEWRPTDMDGRQTIVDVRSGWSHVIALTSVGSVLAWGRSDFGQLGTPQGGPAPRIVPVPERVRSICCGSEHSLCLGETRLWAFGWNEHGNLGTGCTNNSFEPVPVGRLPSGEIVCVTAGGAISFTCVRRINVDAAS